MFRLSVIWNGLPMRRAKELMRKVDYLNDLHRFPIYFLDEDHTLAHC